MQRFEFMKATFLRACDNKVISGLSHSLNARSDDDNG
jgi:hypothetical protein